MMNKFKQLKRTYTNKYLVNGFLSILFIIGAIACMFNDEMLSSFIIGGISLLFIVRIIWFIMVTNATEYEISNNFIKTSYGVLSHSLDSIDMTKVTDVATRRSILDRLLGISKVFIISRDKTNPVSVIFGLKKEDCQSIFDFVNENAVDSYVEIRGRKRNIDRV